MAQIAGRLEFKWDWSKQYKRGEQEEAERKWLKQAKESLRAANPGEYVGEVLRWQVADGYACYMVMQEKPLKVVHLDIGDGYAVDPILIRGLRILDVKEMVARERAWEAMFASQDEKKKILKEKGLL